MAYWLLNSAVIAAPGTYTYRLLTGREAADWLRAHPDAVSRVGYPATAEHIAALCGQRPALSREPSVMAPGDEALVVRLPYRVQDPGTKATHEPQAWEYGLLRREE
jgi:hypothetical protein